MTATYITTTIPYVNARPHIGHALELVQADVLARYHRGRGDTVRFQAGTDDWPAMLLASGQQLPTGIFVHDYLTAAGRKISKSGAGSPAGGPGSFEPAALAAEYGADAVRWWLLREVPRVGDADFTVERLVARADDELANGLGNRVVAMICRYRAGRIPAAAGVPPGGEDLDAAIRHAGDRVGAALAGFDFRQATAAVWGIADEANRFVNRVRPWDLARADPAGRLDAVLYLLARACGAAGRELGPFLPDAAARVTAQCTPDGAGRLPDPRPVFRRLSAPAGLRVEQPQQDQQDQGADDPDRDETARP